MGHLLTPFNPKLGTGISVNLMAFCSLVWVGEGVVLDLGDWCSCQNVWGKSSVQSVQPVQTSVENFITQLLI